MPSSSVLYGCAASHKLVETLYMAGVTYPTQTVLFVRGRASIITGFKKHFRINHQFGIMHDDLLIYSQIDWSIQPAANPRHLN